METLNPSIAPSALALGTHDPPWLDRGLYPFTSRYFSTAAGRQHYVDEGKGRPILFVHGTPSWSFEWRHAIAASLGEHRAIAIDHLGFGLSDKPLLAPYRPADHATRLLEFVRALDLRELTLVLHDFGGPIGLPVLFAEPERVRSVVIVNSWAWPHGDDPNVRLVSRLVASPLGRFLYRWLNASPRWLVPATFARRERLTPAIHSQYLGPFANRAERVAPWVLGCELAGSDPFYDTLWAKREHLRSVPTTLVWGLRDPAFGASYLERWRTALPDADLVELPDAGHFPQEEAPERVSDAIVRAASAANSPTVNPTPLPSRS